MNLDALSRAANENTDPDPSDRDFGELMANALRVCLDDLLANRGPMTDEQRKAMFARLGGGGRPAGGDRFGSEIYAKKPWWKSAKDWGGKEAEEYASKGFMGKAIDFMDELASTGMMGTSMGGGGAVKTAKPATSRIARLLREARSRAIQQATQNYGYDAQFDNQLIDRLTESALSGMRALGNRAPATLLETAVRVARTPDSVLANDRRTAISRPLTDEQRRAIFAKRGGGGGGGGGGSRTVQTVIGKDPNTDFRYGGSGDLNRDSRNAHRTQTQQPQAAPGMAGPGNVPKAQDPRYNTPEWQKWKRDVATAITRGGGGSYDSTGFRMGDGTVIPYPTAVGGPQNLPPQLAGIQPFAPPPIAPGDLNFAGGTPYFDERLGRYLTPAEQAAKNAQISQLLAMLPGYVQQPQPAPAPAPAPAPEPVAPQPGSGASLIELPQPKPGSGAGLIELPQPTPPAPQPIPQPQPPAPQPVQPTPPTPIAPEPEPPAPTPPTGGGSNEGTPSWSVPGYGDPALPTRGAPSKAEPAEKAKMPQITPAMLERLRKRIAGE